MVKLAIDFEFTSRTWWESGGQEMWDAVCEGFDGSGVLMDPSLAHPVRLDSVDEDDPDL
jgi:hypothetical protein